VTNSASGYGHKAQGRDRTQLAYWSGLQPWLAIWGVFWTSIFILFSGYAVFFVWNTQNFFTAYISVPIFFGLWIGWSLYMRHPFWRANEMDFVTVRLTTFSAVPITNVGWTHSCAHDLQGIPSFEETDSPEEPPRNLSEKIFNIVF
jgi:amino acid transporter